MILRSLKNNTTTTRVHGRKFIPENQDKLRRTHIEHRRKIASAHYDQLVIYIVFLIPFIIYSSFLLIISILLHTLHSITCLNSIISIPFPILQHVQQLLLFFLSCYIIQSIKQPILSPFPMQYLSTYLIAYLFSQFILDLLYRIAYPIALIISQHTQ